MRSNLEIMDEIFQLPIAEQIAIITTVSARLAETSKQLKLPLDESEQLELPLEPSHGK